MSKTIYDLTNQQARVAAMFAAPLVDKGQEWDNEALVVGVPKVLQSGILIPFSYKLWNGDLWLSPSKGGIVVRDENQVDVPISDNNKKCITIHLEREGIW